MHIMEDKLAINTTVISYSWTLASGTSRAYLQVLLRSTTPSCLHVYKWPLKVLLRLQESSSLTVRPSGS